MIDDLCRTYEGPKVSFKYGGQAYTALTYAKMKKTEFTSVQLKNCLAGKFSCADNATKALKVLEKNNCVYRTRDNKWVITETGLEVIRHFGMARKPPLFTHGLG